MKLAQAWADGFEAAAKDAPQAELAATVAPGTPVERLRAYAGHDAEALLVLDDLLADDALDAEGVTSVDRVRKLLGQVARRMMAAKDNRFGTLAGVLERLIMRERLILGPPPAPPDALEAELDALDGVVLARIQEHAATPITAAELRGEWTTT